MQLSGCRRRPGDSGELRCVTAYGGTAPSHHDARLSVSGHSKTTLANCPYADRTDWAHIGTKLRRQSVNRRQWMIYDKMGLLRSKRRLAMQAESRVGVTGKKHLNVTQDHRTWRSSISSTHDFPLVSHNYGPILYSFRNGEIWTKRRKVFVFHLYLTLQLTVILELVSVGVL